MLSMDSDWKLWRVQPDGAVVHIGGGAPLVDSCTAATCFMPHLFNVQQNENENRTKELGN